MNNSLEKWKASLEKTRQSTFGKIATILGTNEINLDLWDNLEELLIQADIGLKTTSFVLDTLRENAINEGWTKSDQLKSTLTKLLAGLASLPGEISYNSEGPTIIIIVGVNGSGKTTTIAKLCKWFQNQGKDVVLAAADTYRAAAIEQLQSWGTKLDSRVIHSTQGADPGAVSFDAVNSVISRGEDILIIDTAGRLHTKYNLMEELKKIRRVITKSLPGSPHEVWLVMDATTGQNAILQAKAFIEAVGVTGIILSKLDTSAKGGMAFSLQSELGLPIHFAGLGENIDDLEVFDPIAFVDGILSDFE